MKKITSMLLLFLLLWGTGSLKAETVSEAVTPNQLKDGDNITIQIVPSGHSDQLIHFICAKNNLAFAETDATSSTNVWTLKSTGIDQQFYLFNKTANGYMGKSGQTANTQIAICSAEAEGGVFTFVAYGDKVSIKCCNAPTGIEKPENIYLNFWAWSKNWVTRWAANTSNSLWTLHRIVEVPDPTPEGYYPVKVKPEQLYTRNDRHLDAIVFKSKVGMQSLNLASPRKVYSRCLNHTFKAQVGEKVKADFVFTGHHMHGYVYVDFNKDGQFGTTLHEELMTYSYLNGKDSDNKTADAGNVNPPAFTLPVNVNPGVYRMRCKVDWDNVDPSGSSEKGILDNGGSFTDMALHVYGNQCKINVVNNGIGTVSAVDGSVVPATALTGKDFQVKVTPTNKENLMAVIVRHGFNLEGEAAINGLIQYREDKVIAGPNNVVTIPAELMDGDVLITPMKTNEVLIFADEFNGSANSQPKSVWSRSPRWGSTWNRLSSKAKDVVFLEDGNLVCRAIKNEPAFEGETIPNGDVNMRTGAIETSGMNGFNFRYGRVECRALANPFEGTFPAIWMMPSDGTGGWPSCGEIDIFELVNNENKAHHTIHTNWSYNLNHKWTCNEVVDYSQYHVYGLEWDDTSLKFMVDGKVVGTYNKSTNVNELRQYQWPYDRNFYLILNQSVGRQGDWAHKPDVNHTYEFKVDWIRVYQDPHKAKVCELRAAINKVKEYEEGAGMNQYTINHTALNAANEVLAAADTKSTAELQTTIESLKDVAILNQPKTNRFYRLRCADEKSQMKYIQSTQTGNKQDMKAYGDGKGVEGTFLYDGEGFVSYTQGRYCGAGALKNVGEKSVATIGYPINGRMGQYTVKVESQFLNGKDATLSAGSLTNDYTNCGSNWWLEEVDTLQVTFNADATAAYATIYAPSALQCPAGIKAYTGVKNGNTLKLTEIVSGIIPAGTGVLLKGAKEKAGVQKFKVLYDNQENTVDNNDFIGICTSENGVEGKNYYVLGKGSVHTDVIGFYTHTGAANKVVKGFRARLAKENTPAAANSLRMVFDDDEVTGIEGIAEEVNANAIIYDLSGRRVAVPTKGLYIINGKKVYVK